MGVFVVTPPDVGDSLRDCGVDDIGTVVREKVFATFTIELDIVDPIPAADHSPGVPRVREAKARCEIGGRHVDEGAGGYSAITCLLQSAGRDCEVGRLRRGPRWRNEVR
jgi:hypothetical protein